MKTCSLVDKDNENIVLSLLGQTGSAHDNLAYVQSIQTELIDHDKEKPSIITISFHQINFCINQKSRSRKQILHNITGGFSSGMNAILGPSGCGKSSLLDILADRKDTHGLTGQILVFGKSRTKNFKYSIGYVVQEEMFIEDIISGTLSVRENLMFSANIRLQRTKTLNERIEIVNGILRDLSLEQCADTRIGTHFIRGVSGGEKRRACIGMELVLSPKILFLDEPTSGLDASTAETVMKSLFKLSRQGCTIIFSIHQPRYSIYKLFDNVLLLSSGHTVYLGPSNNLLSYFALNGFKCEEHDNPTDFVLDVLIHCNTGATTSLQTAYLQSVLCLKNESLIINENLHENYLFDPIIIRSRLIEFYYVSIRTFLNTIRDPAMVASQIIVAIFLALLTGLVFNQIHPTVEHGVQNRLGAIFFIIVNQIYSTATALEPLIHERTLFLHENASGYYRVSTFFIAKLICDLLPMRLIPSIIFSIITYFMTGFRVSTKQFFIYFLTIFLGTIFGSATCFAVASFIPIFVVSLITIVFIFVVMMVFSGFLIDLQSIFVSLRWIQWISAFRYATNILTINEFRNLSLCLENNTKICPLTGEQILIDRYIAYETDWDLWKNFIALIMMIIVFLFLAFIQLLTMKKVK